MALNKTQLLATLSDDSGVSKKEVGAVLDALQKLVVSELGKGKKTDSKQVTIPGICKIVTKYKPATKERKGIDPFTKLEKVFKAKPASQQVKIRALKALKDAAQ